MPQSLCVTTRRRRWRRPRRRGVEADRARRAEQRQVALHASARAVALRLDPRRSEGDAVALEDLVVDGRSMLALSSSPRAFIPPVPSRTFSDAASTSSSTAPSPAGASPTVERRLPGGDVDQQVVAGLRRGAGAARVQGQGAVVRSELVRARRRHAPTLSSRTGIPAIGRSLDRGAVPWR